MDECRKEISTLFRTFPDLLPAILTNIVPRIAGESKPCNSASDAEIGSWSVRKRFGKLRIVDSVAPPAIEEVAVVPAPPRPPKPAHMSLDNPGHNYLNLDGATESSKPVTPATPAPSTPAATAVVTDETYDFPRSHQPGAGDSGTMGRQSRHCYTNAAPTNASGECAFVIRAIECW